MKFLINCPPPLGNKANSQGTYHVCEAQILSSRSSFFFGVSFFFFRSSAYRNTPRFASPDSCLTHTPSKYRVPLPRYIHPPIHFKNLHPPKPCSLFVPQSSLFSILALFFKSSLPYWRYLLAGQVFNSTYFKEKNPSHPTLLLFYSSRFVSLFTFKPTETNKALRTKTTKSKN